MTLKLEHTSRGFGRIDFLDRYGFECSIQASSLATEDAIWFGVSGNRMHLTRDLVGELLPVLQHFASTGELRGEGSVQRLNRRAGEVVMLTWKDLGSVTGVESWEATSGRVTVGYVVRLGSGAVEWRLSAMSRQRLVKGCGATTTIALAKRALSRAWRVWLEKAQLRSAA